MNHYRRIVGILSIIFILSYGFLFSTHYLIYIDRSGTQVGGALHIFYWFTCILTACLLLYLCFQLRRLVREKQRNEDLLRRAEYSLAVEKELLDAPFHNEHFVLALQKIAAFFEAEQAFFLTTEEGEDSSWLCSSLTTFPPDREQALTAMLQSLTPALGDSKELICPDVGQLFEQYPAVRQYAARFGLHRLILFLVPRADANTSLVLGVADPAPHWKDTSALCQVALPLAIALDHRTAGLQLRRLSQTDALTGLLNRNSYHLALERYGQHPPASLGCVYIDANGLHQLNNRLGHQAGDVMLQAVADALLTFFAPEQLFRIGGDEFVVLASDLPQSVLEQRMEKIMRLLDSQGYTISTGIVWQELAPAIQSMVLLAEERMRANKLQYYKNKGQEQQMRTLDERLEAMLAQKQDAEGFLSYLAPEFLGVYFVDLRTDGIRHLYIPPYFASYLEQTDHRFSQALRLYIENDVQEKYRSQFNALFDYKSLDQQLRKKQTPELLYQKKNGDWVLLRVLQFKGYSPKDPETLWIFTPYRLLGNA